jgi:tyrosine-protein phosphatase OCA1
MRGTFRPWYTHSPWGLTGRQNFGLVEDNLYRSGQPNELNFPFLERLGLKTVIFLAPEEPNQKLYHTMNAISANGNSMEFMDDQETRWHHLPIMSTELISEEVVLEALGYILDPSNFPLMVMCNFGRHRTGTIIGCLRKLQQWSLTSIFEEYRRFAGSKVRVLNEQVRFLWRF